MVGTQQNATWISLDSGSRIGFTSVFGEVVKNRLIEGKGEQLICGNGQLAKLS
jgi:hypothetical protein